MQCRHCRAEVTLPFIDLGTAPPSNAYLTAAALAAPETYYPLRVRTCANCWLVQTEDYAGRGELFASDYAYFSSYSTSWLEHARRYVELAADVGAHRIRVFGDDLKATARREDCTRYVGESLRAVAEFAQPLGVDVLLEMHGQFNYWGFARAAVEAAGHPRVALVYNCDVRDLVAGSVAATYARVRGLIRHVHMHTFYDGFPYPELLSLLAADGYAGYLSSEIEGIENPTREQYFAMYAALFRAWACQPFFPGAA